MEKDMNLATAFAELNRIFAGKGMDDYNFELAKPFTDYISGLWDINARQCMLLSCMLTSMGEEMTTGQIASHIGIDNLMSLTLQKDIDGLVGKGYVVVTKNPRGVNWEQTLMLSSSVIYAIRYNKQVETDVYKHLTAWDVMGDFADITRKCDYGEMDYPILVNNIHLTLKETRHLHFSRRLLDYKLTNDELMLLIIACVHLVMDEEETITPYDYDDIIPKGRCRMLQLMFKHKVGNLKGCGLMELCDESEGVFRITDDFKYDLLSEYENVMDSKDNTNQESTKETADEVDTANDEKTEEIVEKTLFYNPTEQVQIDRLANLLSEEKYSEIKMRIKKSGMRMAFTCLFYGAPGTGKTETVMQLARKTGRKVITVNLSTLKSMWVGESEKNIQKVFDDYKETVAKSELTPILLFNEADGIFGKRYKRVDSEAEQSANTIQNIILQNMEQLDGILIATTNLTENLDNAFERRFLYKIEFNRPSLEVRKKIWQSMMPELSVVDCNLLARKYSFSGGQMENIARKAFIDSLLYDNPVNVDMVAKLCDEENINKNGNGFQISNKYIKL